MIATSQQIGIIDLRAANNAALSERIRAAMQATERPEKWWVRALRIAVEIIR